VAVSSKKKEVHLGGPRAGAMRGHPAIMSGGSELEGVLDWKAQKEIQGSDEAERWGAFSGREESPL